MAVTKTKFFGQSEKQERAQEEKTTEWFCKGTKTTTPM